MTDPTQTPDNTDAGSESTDGFELSPADLTGTVHEMQAALRERYGATEAEIDADNHAYRNGDTAGLHAEVAYRLTWLRETGDLPRERGQGPTESALTLAEQKLERARRDFPEADLTCFTAPDHVQVNVKFGRQA